MNQLPKINVIMSTYNGEEYIRTQIDSILSQKDVDITLNVFDDVSTDKTLQILKEYEDHYSNIHVFQNEKNKNFTYNFIDSLFIFKDNNSFDYYAFADQDDLWKEDKLIIAINKIKQLGNNCVLYSSNLQIVDENLNDLGRPYRTQDYKPKKHDEIRYNIVTGCTMVFDNACKNLFTKHYPCEVNYHDHWFGLIANYSKGCHYIYDNEPSHILYRQHQNNVSGGYKEVGFIKRLQQRFGKRKTDFKKLKQFLLYYFNEIKEEDRMVIEKFVNYKKFSNKIWLLKNFDCTNIKRFKLSLLMNKYVDGEV